MTSTTHSEFNHFTEGLDVAKAFPEEIRGKTILVTGVNRGGIGYYTVEAFASQAPAHIIIAGRTPSKLHDSIAALRENYPNVQYHALELNLSSQKAVRAAAATLLSWKDVPSINIVVNSAGIMLVPERTITEDGVELHFATNHIGHFLFTCLIMPKLIKAGESSSSRRGATRVINVSARSPVMNQSLRWSDPNFETPNKDLPAIEQPNYRIHVMWVPSSSESSLKETSYIPLEAYSQSKISNLLFSIALTKRLFEKHGILSMAVHPGVIMTELGRNMTEETMAAVKVMEGSMFQFKTLGGGAATSLVAALDPALGVGEEKDGKENYGAYLSDCQIDTLAQPLCISSGEAERLWALSEKMVGETFAW